MTAVRATREFERALRKKGVLFTCPECGREIKYYSAGLCRGCYARKKRRDRGIPERSYWGKHKFCRICGASEVKALGLCQTCYGRHLEAKNIEKRRVQKRKANQKKTSEDAARS